MHRSVLVVEDDELFGYALADRLRREALEVEVVRSTGTAFSRLESRLFDLAVVDYQLPDGTGLDLLRRLRVANGSDPVDALMVTAFGSIDGAVQAMHAGCVDYVSKENSLDEIAMRVGRALERVELRHRVSRYEGALARDASAGSGMVGESSAMAEVRRQIAVAARAPDTTVLIRGETGTGKQLVAQALHSMSPRGNKPFVHVDCTTLAANLLESELFGHERGAFTGADRRKLGLVEVASGGSLLLDEIGELDASGQSKLLRLLQERTFRRVGGNRDTEVDVRIVAATNRNLEKEVERKRFREDLYYRLRVLEIEVPPLRHRGEDVIQLARHFLEEFARKLGKPELRLSSAAIASLREHAFPGNVRELRALIEQAAVRAEGPRLTALLPSASRDRQRDRERARDRTRKRGRPREEVSTEEARRIQTAMERHFGNKTRAAEELGMSRFTLKRKLLRMREP